MFHSTMQKGSVNVNIWFEIGKRVVGALNADKVKPPSFRIIIVYFRKLVY